MTVVFVHGVPESADIWKAVIESLGEQGVSDVVTLSPPGFGVPSPDGWDASAPNYVRWLITELEALSGPIDIVGHDWGAGHVYGLLAVRPELVRSWAADIAGLIHPDYEWHEMAQAWQTPEVGEQVIEMMTAQPLADRQASFEALGVDTAAAAAMAEAVGDDMGRCILGLYRSAVPPYGGELGAALAGAELPPGLVVDATADTYVDRALSLEMAERFGADVLTLDGQGHWWMSTAAAGAATGLASFWAGLG